VRERRRMQVVTTIDIERWQLRSMLDLLGRSRNEALSLLVER